MNASCPPDRSLPIAVFDSGVGGLTVLHECLVSLPEEDYLYLGDDDRFPYGAKSEERAARVRRAQHRVPARPRREADRHRLQLRGRRRPGGRARARRSRGVEVVAVIEPEAEIAAAITDSGRVGVLATPATVVRRRLPAGARPATPRAHRHRRWRHPTWRRSSSAAFPFSEEVVDKVRSYCAPLKRARVDTVILGCTHYPLVRADAPALPRARGAPGERRPRARGDRAADPRVTAAGDAAARGGHLQLRLHRATRSGSASSGPAFCSFRSGDVERVDL